MPKKPRQRYKDRFKSKSKADPKPVADPLTSAEIIRNRRNKRFLFIAVMAILFPILELIAYRFRGITISIVNRSDVVHNSVKVTYDGGEFQTPALKPGQSDVKVIRPNFTFSRDKFSTYLMTVRVDPQGGTIIRYMGNTGALDFSATEIYTIISTPTGVESIPPKSELQIQHNTRLGFPLSLVRDLMRRIGLG